MVRQQINYKEQLKLMFQYQDKINKTKKHRNKFFKKMGFNAHCSEIDEESFDNQVSCYESMDNEKNMCYMCKVVNFYRLYIRKYSAKKRSILMKLRHEVMKGVNK